jgi:hypothetical protein
MTAGSLLAPGALIGGRGHFMAAVSGSFIIIIITTTSASDPVLPLGWAAGTCPGTYELAL